MMLTLVLGAILLLAWGVEAKDTLTVNVNCDAGKFIGDVTIEVISQYSKDYDGYESRVYYLNGDSTISKEDSQKTFDKDNLCKQPDDTKLCNECSFSSSNAKVGTKVIVITPVKREGDNEETYTYEEKEYTVSITATNADSLSVTGNSTGSKITKYVPKVSKIFMDYKQKFEHESSSEKPENYCVDGIYNYYPKGDCYTSGKEGYSLTLKNLSFVENGSDTPEIYSVRSIKTISMDTISVENETNFMVEIYPGIYQGEGSPSVKAESTVSDKLEMKNITLNEKLHFTLEGDVKEVKWDTINDEVSDKGIEFNITKRNHTTWPRDNDPREVFCPGITCSHIGDEAPGNLTTHSMKNVKLSTGSKIGIDGYVGTISAEGLSWSTTRSGGDASAWAIVGKNEASGEHDFAYSVKNATFKDCTINTDIVYSAENLTIEGTSKDKSTFQGYIISESNVVSIKNSVMEGYIRHTIDKSLTLENVDFKGDTYYDHPNMDNTESTSKGYRKYPTVSMNQLNISKDFVVSVDNNDGKDNGTFDMMNITCEHNHDLEENWDNPEYDFSKLPEKVLLVRHMSNIVNLFNVNYCNIYFKNTATSTSKNDFVMADSGTHNVFTYNIDETAECPEGKCTDDWKNDFNNYTIFDDAGYHVTSTINIKGKDDGNHRKIGQLKYNKLAMDQRELIAANNSNTYNGHAPEYDTLPEPGYDYKHNGNIMGKVKDEDDEGTFFRSYGDNYPMNLNMQYSDIKNVYFTDEDELGMQDPTGVENQYYVPGKMSFTNIWDYDYENYNTANSNYRDVSYKEDASRMLEGETIQHLAEDLNLDIQNGEIQTIYIRGDSVMLKLYEILSRDILKVESNNTSSIIMHKSRLYDTFVYNFESLLLDVDHSVFDRNGGVYCYYECDIDFKDTIFNNNLEDDYKTTDGWDIYVEVGSINLDHIKAVTFIIDAYVVHGDINVIQAFPCDGFSIVSIASELKPIDVVHPDKFYRDMTSLINFEHASGSVANTEHAYVDIFAFEPAASTTALYSVTDNLSPFVKYSKFTYLANYGTVHWEYAKNLEYGGIKEYDIGSTIKATGYDNVVGVSTINAIAMESFGGYDLSNLNYDKAYAISVRDHTGTEDLIEGYDSNEFTCYKDNDNHDPLDICTLYVILPTTDLTGRSEMKDNNGISLELDSVNVYLKDLMSSPISNIKISGANGVYIANTIANEIEVNLKHYDYTYYSWTRDSIYAYLRTLTANKITINGDAERKSAAVYLGLSLTGFEYDELKILPANVRITPVSDGAYASIMFRKVVPENQDDENAYITCSGTKTNPGDSTYPYCTQTFNGSAEDEFTGNFLGNSNDSIGSVTINNVTGNKFNNSSVTVTYSRTLGEQYYGFDDNNKLAIERGDRIIIDNHRFASDFSSYFNLPWSASTPTPSINNIYVVPSRDENTRFIATVDTNADNMFYSSQKGNKKTHKFNLIEQAQMILYIPKADDISIRAASYNINLILSDIGTYDRIYNNSYIVANVLKAKSIWTSYALIWSLEGNGVIDTELGYIGIDVDKVSADVFIENYGTYDKTDLSDSIYSDLAPIIVMEKGTMDDINVFTASYKSVWICSAAGCETKYVPCADEECEIVNYLWEPNSKQFAVGNDYSSKKASGDVLGIMFLGRKNASQKDGEQPNASIVKRYRKDDRDKAYESTYNKPNAPIYLEDLRGISALSIRGTPKASPEFDTVANKNNRYVDPNEIVTYDVTPPEDEGTPTWALVLLIFVIVFVVVAVAYIVLRFLNKGTLEDLTGGSVGIGIN